MILCCSPFFSVSESTNEKIFLQTQVCDRRHFVSSTGSWKKYAYKHELWNSVTHPKFIW